MNIEKIRQDFPILRIKLKGKPIVYFDNACQTLRPQSVIDAMNAYYQKYSACAGRSVHKMGETVTKECEKARKIVANFINAKNQNEIVFTRNTTESINLIARSLNLKHNDIVLTTDKEHNSNLAPWQIMAKKIGIVHQIIPSREDNTFDLEKFKEIINKRVKLVSIVYTSNLDGVSNPISEIVKIVRQYGAKVLVDAAQTAPHQKIDVRKLDVDFLAFSGHKMLGPSGIGILYGRYDLLEELEPFLVGGETVEYSTYQSHKLLPPPAKFEAGLQDYAGIIGLGRAIKYLENVGFENIAKQEYALNNFITEEINKIDKLRVIGPRSPNLRGGIVSFYRKDVKDIDHHQIALILDESANIAIRSGQHCVHSWFSANQIYGSVRASFYFYNTLEEAEIFIENLKKVIELS